MGHVNHNECATKNRISQSGNFFPQVPAVIFSADRIIVAVSEEVLIPINLTWRGNNNFRRIRIDKPSPGRVIIPAAEVVQARLGVIDIPAIAQGVCSAEGGGHGAAGGHGCAPGVIGVGHHLGAAGIDKTGNVALGVFQIRKTDIQEFPPMADCIADISSRASL